jgi:hypothetical protein
LEETFKEFVEFIGQPTIPVLQEPSLEDSLKTFKQTINQSFQEITDATVANTDAIGRLKGQLDHLVAEFNIIEEEEFQSHEMWREQDMIDKHAQATTFRSEEVAKETINKPSLEYHTLEVQTEKGETTEISFPNLSSLSAKPFILDNHFSMPSSYIHPP